MLLISTKLLGVFVKNLSYIEGISSQKFDLWMNKNYSQNAVSLKSVTFD
jgi:hypothetical protein